MNVLEEIRVPHESVNDEFATVTALHVEKGDLVEVGAPLVNVETSKTVLELESTTAGVVEVLVALGDEVPVGSILIRIVDQLPEMPAGGGRAGEGVTADLDESLSTTKFSLSASRLIDELGIPQARFSGMDLVTERDVRMVIGKVEDSPVTGLTTEMMSSRGEGIPTVDFDVQRLTPGKRSEIRILRNALPEGLASTIHVFVEWGRIDGIPGGRTGILDGSILPIVVFEVSRLLRKYPLLNGFYTKNGIGIYSKVNIGIATDIDDGLKVLTLRDTDKKTIQEIENEIVVLIDRYLDRELTVVDLSESTFTITDMTSLGVDLFVPLINMHQSAILGISKFDETLKRFWLSVVFDHRVTEGKPVAEFLTNLKSRLESYPSSHKGMSKEPVDNGSSCESCRMTVREDQALGGPGLIRLIAEGGVERCICRNCLMGF